MTRAKEILSRTPYVLEAYLKDISKDWYMANEGPNTWSPFDVIGHLVHGEQTDWIQRVKIILSDATEKKFAPFDRLAQFTKSEGKTLNELVAQFKMARKENLQILDSLNISDEQLDNTGIHPAFGSVTLQQLLATWVVHDLTHIAQITRVMALQYKAEVGPWIQYLSVLSR